jgi:hypothetical protein
MPCTENILSVPGSDVPDPEYIEKINSPLPTLVLSISAYVSRRGDLLGFA